MGTNIHAANAAAPKWDQSNVEKSLSDLKDYVEGQAREAIKWYYQRKAGKARLSFVLRFCTILFTAFGGLVPIASSAFVPQPYQMQVNQLGYLAVGLAGLFLALDRFTGSSSGWMRYISAAMKLETLLEEFRLDWLKLAAANAPVNAANAGIFLDRVKSLALAVRGEVEKETQAWIAEFQSNLAQLEKETKEALDSAREAAKKEAAAAEAARRAEAEAHRSGVINVTVESKTALDAGFSVELDGKLYRDGVTGTTCGIANVSPGNHEIAITAMAAGKKVCVSRAVLLKGSAAEDVKVSLT